MSALLSTWISDISDNHGFRLQFQPWISISSRGQMVVVRSLVSAEVRGHVFFRPLAAVRWWVRVVWSCRLLVTGDVNSAAVKWLIAEQRSLISCCSRQTSRALCARWDLWRFRVEVLRRTTFGVADEVTDVLTAIIVGTTTSNILRFRVAAHLAPELSQSPARRFGTRCLIRCAIRQQSLGLRNASLFCRTWAH